MASSYSQEVDIFETLINAKDVKGRLAASKDFISYLADPSSNLQSADLMKIIDSIVPWIQSGNFKVNQAGLDVLLQMCNRMGSDFKMFVPVVLGVIVDRLGDSKDVIRERCQLLISKMIENKTILPQNVLEKVVPCFTNKNTYIRGEALDLLSCTIDLYGNDKVNIIKFLPYVVKLLTDSNFLIRENAIKCLSTIYRHVGEEMKVELLKGHVSGSIPSQKLHQILKKLDDIKLSNKLLPSAVNFGQRPDLLSTEKVDNKQNGQGQEDILAVDKSKKSVSFKSMKGSHNFKNSFETRIAPSGSLKNPSSKVISSAHLQSTYKSINSNSRNRSGSTSAGAVDEDYFIRAIEDSIKVQTLSSREIGNQIIEIKEVVGNVSVDWNKRVEALKKLRGLIAAGADNYEDFPTQVYQLESSVESAVKDLRSQVVREACITISFLGMKLENRFDCFAERILPHVVPLLMSAAKVVSSSGLICLQLVLRHTHSVRLLPTIINNLSSKSKEIRKAMCKLMNLIINTWPEQVLKKCSFLLEDGIKKGIVDADSEARDFARKAYWAFQEHFPEQADVLLQNIDPAYHRTILNEGSTRITSSSNTRLISNSTSAITNSFQQELNEYGSKGVMHTDQIMTPPIRSHSWINFQLARWLKSEAEDCVQQHRKVSSETSLLQSRIFLPAGASFNSGQKYVDRTKNQVPKKSHPSSSSASNSSRNTLRKLHLSSGSNLSTAEKPLFLTSFQFDDSKPVVSKLSNDNESVSFESTSPFESKINRINGKTPIPSSKLTSVVGQTYFEPTVETESVLSESLSSSWNGSQQKIFGNSNGAEDINKIILNCGSNHWSDRKKGLVELTIYLQAGSRLKPILLRRMTGHFTKMFVDSHTKDFSLFLSTLDFFIVAHKTDLNFWLYVLLSRLLNKLGVDLLGSIHIKIHKSLDTVRESFSNDILMSVMLRYIGDATQTPNSRVKIAACSYTAKLAAGMDASLAFLLSSTDQFKVVMPSAVAKMIEWKMDGSKKKDGNLMKAIHEAIISLFNLDQSKGILYLSFLPQECQEAVEDLIKFASSHSSVSINVESESDCSSSVSPRFVQNRSMVQKTNVSAYTQKSLFKKSYCSESEAEKIHHNDVYFSIQQNPSQKQHLVYRSDVKNFNDKELSHLSSNKTNLKPLIQPKMDSTVLKNQTNQLIITRKTLTAIDSNSKDYNIEQNEMIMKTLESMKSCFDGDYLINQKFHPSYQEIKIILNQLIQIVADKKFSIIVDHFKLILRFILTQLDCSDFTVQSLVLSLLTEIIKKTAFVDSFNDSVELLVLKIFKSFKNGNEDVRRSADVCSTTIATHLSPELVVGVLIPLISAEDYPVNVCAIKLLTKVIETRGKDHVRGQNYLPDIMPRLIQAYDNEVSSVRKSAVFCMVALHVCLGEEELRPYLSSLCGSKLKLLQIYIKRAKEPLSK